MDKRMVSAIGVILGIAITIGGFCIMGIDTEASGKIGATSIDVIIDGIGWVMVAIGVSDIVSFYYKSVAADEDDSRDNRMYSSVATLKRSGNGPVAGGWTCTCGRNHAAYESSCVCGVTKAEIRSKNSQNK